MNTLLIVLIFITWIPLMVSIIVYWLNIMSSDRKSLMNNKWVFKSLRNISLFLLLLLIPLVTGIGPNSIISENKVHITSYWSSEFPITTYNMTLTCSEPNQLDGNHLVTLNSDLATKMFDSKDKTVTIKYRIWHTYPFYYHTPNEILSITDIK